MKLSDRLESIMSLVPECEALADIGTDHGFVPIELVRRGVVRKAIASDVRKGPLSRAEAHIREAGLSDRIEVRLGSGLQTLKKGEVKAVLIAGMGGCLMGDLLSEKKDILETLDALILSPHKDAAVVRKTCEELGFSITKETMVEEDGKFYPIMKLERMDKKVPYTEEELAFGPLLLKERPAAFSTFLHRELEKNEAVLEKLRERKKGGKVLEEKEAYQKKLRSLLNIS